MSQKATLIIDYGNSETRAIVEYGAFDGVNRKSHLLMMSNKFAITNRLEGDLNETSYPSNNEDYHKETLVFNLNKPLKIGSKRVKKGQVIHGEFAEKNYPVLNFGPKGKKPKYDNGHTVLTTVTAIFKAAQKIAPELNLTTSEVLSNFVWDLTVLLPPQQMQDTAKIEQLKTDLKDISDVDIVYPANTQCNITIVSVTAQKEGYTAFFGTVFDRRTKRPYKGLNNILKSRALVLDIGAGTTDVMIIDSGRAISSSEKTINIGGNDVLAKTKKYSGYDRNESVFEKAVTTGKIKSSGTEIDVVSAVNEAKNEVGQMLANALTSTYMDETGIDLESVEYLIVVGGGSLDAENDEIENISDTVVEELKDYAENIQLVTANTDKYEDDIMPNDKLVSPRTVNVIGASILTDIRDLQQQTQK